MMSTCSWLGLESLGSWPTMPQTLPGPWRELHSMLLFGITQCYNFCCISHFFANKGKIGCLGHYGTLTSLIGRKLHWQQNERALCNSKYQVTLNTMSSEIYMHRWREEIIVDKCTYHPSNIKTWPPTHLLLIDSKWPWGN